MIANYIKTPLPLAVLVALVMMLAGSTSALAVSPPVKLVLSSHFGREVNLTEVGAKGGPALEDVCTVESKDECGIAKESSIPGGFAFPQSVAGAANGNVYVIDQGNARVQELTSTGEFVLMFGREVNATTKGDVCLAGGKCKAGVRGTAAGQFSTPDSVTVDPVGGNVYVSEDVEEKSNTGGKRVQEFTAGGQFVLEIGKEVNEKTKGNLCTEKEVEEKLGVKCIEPAPVVPGSSEHGAFNFATEGGLLAAGGEGNLVYVGDESRVQELDATTGEWKGEIPLEPANLKVEKLAIDEATGDLYLIYGASTTTIIEEFNPKGEKVKDLEVTPREKNGKIRNIVGLAIDSNGHLAVLAQEQDVGKFGALYNASTGNRITEFAIPGFAGTVGELGFNGQNELYATGGSGVDPQVVVYKPEFVAELLTGVAGCVPGVEVESSVTLDCTMSGEVNPEGVSGTEAWFEWGRSEILGEQTPKQKVEATGPVHATIAGRPNETFYYQLAGEDVNVKAPETLTGERVSFVTPIVAPKVVGAPSVSFVEGASAVLFGELNPENVNTEYFFEYAEGEALGVCPGLKIEACPGVARTAGAQSTVYGRIAAVLEASGLQPGARYAYRLTASNAGGEASGPEGSFTTAAAPLPSAQTGSASAVTASDATVSGMVDPDGLPATYAFELGVYEGAGTQYGIVFSGPAGSSSVAVEEALGLTGLQPGTTYAYRITVSSGYINNESHTLRGAPSTFTTGGLPSVLGLPAVMAQLPIPNIAFPAAATSTTRALTNAQKLAQALKVCKRKSKKQRATCERQTRKKYKNKSKAKGRKAA
jgi:DNA-binding beta-propeller fold protein YncE